MPKLINLLGKCYGMLTVTGPRTVRNKRTYWECTCECGVVCLIDAYHLKYDQKSCGCLRKKNIKNKTHGHTSTGKQSVEYRTWAHMKSRCYNPKTPDFKYYGARGITVCDEWLHDFQKFFDHVGYRPSLKHSIDRINNNGNYEPGNVRWATTYQQCHNRSISRH